MKRAVILNGIILLNFAAAIFTGTVTAQTRFMEKLDRGVVAVKVSDGVYVGWRLFGTDPTNTGFNIYRNSVKLNSSPITASTNYLDTAGTTASIYTIVPVIGGVEQAASEPVTVWDSYCRSITLASVSGSYAPNDASVGDLDGDGQYEIVLKRLSTDISQASTTFHLIEAYRLDGTFMWRINLGPNNLYAPEEINPIVYDFDGDGYSEVALRTCEGNIDGTGVGIGDMDGDGKTDYRSSIATPGSEQWFMTEGPEFLSIFDGLTGREIARADYIERDPISQWGGSTLGQQAHRANKCMMTPAYLDGQRPSLVICRGIYVRIKMEAWDFRDGSLSKIWAFDTANWSGYAGQGNHNLSVGDVDSDGRDEIVYASMCVDDNGNGLYTTGLGHGDAMHMSDMIPGRSGLEVFACHESSPYGTTLRDAGTGEILWQKTADGDTGRCCAAHVDSRYPGYQMWSVASGGTYNAVDKALISTNVPNWGNFLIWWDSDLQREILDVADSAGHPKIDKWGGDGAYRLLSLYNVPTSYGTLSINGSKGNPCLSGDILGDWREECIYRSDDNTQLRIYTTTTVASYRFYTLMHDSQYRTAIAWQCNMYNQPPHPSFYIGADMADPPTPDILPVTPGGDTVPPAAPAGLTAYADGAQVILDWADNTETDLASYMVYRSTVSGGPYIAVAINLTSSTYTDNGVVNGIIYYYAVIAVDTSDNGSFRSSEASVTGGPDCVAYYKLDGNVSDNSGNGNHATASGAPAYTTGRIGQAMDLDGSNDFIALPAAVANSTDITVAAWVNWDGGNQWQRIFDFGNGTSQYLFLTPRSGDNTLRFAIKNGGSEQIVETTQLTAGQWVHVAVTLNGDTATLYVNGSPAVAGSTVTINPSDFNSVFNYIGDSQWTADPFFNGRIDDFRVYNFALSAAQVAVTMAGNTAPMFTVDPIVNLDAVELDPYAGQSLAAFSGDADGMNTVTFSKISGPDWLTVESDGTLSGVPDNTDVGINTFLVQAADNGGMSDITTMHITVANVYSGVAGLEDLIGMAQKWLMQGCTDTPACGGADLDDDFDVDWGDFSVLANNWLPQDLQLYLKLDQASGTIARDSSIYSRPGLLIDGPVWSTGHTDGGLVLDGVDDYVTVTYNADLNPVDFTVTFWVRVDGNTDIYRTPVCSRDVTGGFYSGYNVFAGSSNTWDFWTGAGDSTWDILTGPAVSDGQWTHIGLTFQATSGPDAGGVYTGIKVLYINGIPEASSTTARYVPNVLEPFTLGRINHSQLWYFNGGLDDVRIYSRALTASEIALLAQ